MGCTSYLAMSTGVRKSALVNIVVLLRANVIPFGHLPELPAIFYNKHTH